MLDIQFKAKLKKIPHSMIDDIAYAYPICAVIGPVYKQESEDNRNTYIRDMLTSKDLKVYDQTLWGKSAVGKKAGEIDIKIDLDNNLPFTIIEAFIINNLNQNVISNHLVKIFGYDPTGLRNLFLINQM